ncbi:PEP-CTERM sorting domain-containing protein [Aestuariibacter sp. GS-14]|uniref:Npun_F0296 family exosortase-dependent surface protein n=1 Tax=Aestuariibacter sp. GS-14 TaxID=2590670 RepID=UPI0011290CB5|nr:PEP-CTERM sorting domain-containing protein [Aestuariibacter sp. GS-14]TPV62094.1 PEP-CTERM sorting domain-containing protein [Aestuariibacter sp. GS-14]
MKALSILSKALPLTVALAFASTTQAATISFGGVTANDGSGLTSSYIDPLTGGQADYFIESFDQATNFSGLPGSIAYNDPGFDQECSVNSANGGPAGVTVTANASEVGIRKGSVANVAAAPAGDTTCFGYLTNNGSGVATTVFDYSALLSYYTTLYSSNTLLGITYLGFYWGSVDTYNDFEFYSDGNLVTSITGSQLLSALGGQSGNQTSSKSNVYVNIDFSIAEQFDTLVIKTSGIAGEFDNIVVGLSTREIPVPAPTGLALFAFGLIALGLRSRLKK